MHTDKYIVVYYDGNNHKVAIKSEPKEISSGDTSEFNDPFIWGFPEDFTVIAVISPADPIEDSVVWIDNEEQVFHD